MTLAAVDQYLSSVIANLLRGKPAPAWPDHLIGHDADASQRVAFHGIALFIAQAPGALDSWPPALALSVRKQAGLQTFWEHSHRAAIQPLLEALASAGLSATVIKGTALAYSVYPDAALRRRGDTDILVPGGHRKEVREVLRACGFWQTGDTKALQESWQRGTSLGFEPAIDVHWHVNTSSAVSRVLATGLRLEETIALTRLSSIARSVGPVDNLILGAVNRRAHRRFGYIVGKTRIFESDRLIWAVDTHLITSAFGPSDWQALVDRATRTGTAEIVRDSLYFAATTLGTKFPAEIEEALSQAPADQGIAAYFGQPSHLRRLQNDLAACHSWGEALRVIRYVALPSSDFLHSRFPDAAGWPRPVLHLRRWVEGTAKLLTGNG